MTEEYEFYSADPYEPPYEIGTKFIAIDNYDLLNETGKYEPTPHELADRMRGNIRATETKLLQACKRWIMQSRQVHAMKKKTLGLI